MLELDISALKKNWAQINITSYNELQEAIREIG